MRIIKPSFEILTQNLSKEDLTTLRLIERAGRTCYKSEENINDESAIGFVGARLNEDHHESIIEHSSLTVKFICDRGVSHELVRHRLASFSQESTRYCNYSKGRHGNQLTFIQPPWISDDAVEVLQNCSDPFDDILNISIMNAVWFESLKTAEYSYLRLLESGWKPEQARSVLPNSLKTEIVVTANFREWRLIFKQRTSEKAHPQMRELMIPLLEEVRSKIPVIFDIL